MYLHKVGGGGPGNELRQSKFFNSTLQHAAFFQSEKKVVIELKKHLELEFRLVSDQSSSLLFSLVFFTIPGILVLIICFLLVSLISKLHQILISNHQN